MRPHQPRGDSVSVPPGSSPEVRRLAGELARIDRDRDPVGWARASHDLGLALAEDHGRLEEAIGALERSRDVLLALDPVPPELALVEYNLADTYRRRITSDPEDGRDAAIRLLERCVEHDPPPVLISKAYGSLGDLYARRLRGVRGDNQRRALDAYERSLLVIPPLVSEPEWALNSHNMGLTLLEYVDGDSVVNAAESLRAHWQAASASGDADPKLRGRAIRGCVDALDELQARLTRLDAPSPFEVAMPLREGPEAASQGVMTRARATVGVTMMELHEIAFLVPDQLDQAGRLWEKVAREAPEEGMPSLGGVAHLNVGRLFLRRSGHEPEAVEQARLRFAQALLALDPVLHPWAWARTRQELANLDSPESEES
jgi:tetratricopeptide (TPR) repeat protein